MVRCIICGEKIQLIGGAGRFKLLGVDEPTGVMIEGKPVCNNCLSKVDKME